MKEYRNVYDADGHLIHQYYAVFPEIPEDFEIKDFAKNIQGLNSVSETMALAYLYHTDGLPPWCDPKVEYISSSLRELALSYVISADALRKSYHESIQDYKDTGGKMFNPHFHEPCGYCCRHAIELMLKYLLYTATGDIKEASNTHGINKLWRKVKSLYENGPLTRYDTFIGWIDEMDVDGTRLRYGCTNKGEPHELVSYIFDMDTLVDDTKCFFNLMYAVLAK